METIYQIKQTSLSKQKQIFLTRHFQFIRLGDNFYFYIITVTDLFDCETKREGHLLSYEPRHQRRLERAIKKGGYIPIEDFSNKEYTFHSHRWQITTIINNNSRLEQAYYIIIIIIITYVQVKKYKRRNLSKEACQVSYIKQTKK